MAGKREKPEEIVSKLRQVEVLQDTCRAGKLRFDLDPKSFFVTGDVVAETIDCNAP